MKGWHKESYRHYLAAKGVSTSKTAPKKHLKRKFVHQTKVAFRQSLKPKELILPSSKQEKMNADVIYTGLQIVGLDKPIHRAVKKRKMKRKEKENEKKQYMASKSKIPIPPAWKNVKHHKDKLYVVSGVDEKGRTQYIYPKEFSEKTTSKKFKRIKKLGVEAPAIMQKVQADIDKENNPEAEVVYTIYKTGFRPGSDKDTLADKKAFGASNLLKKQVDVKGDKVHFKFTGKKGVEIDKTVKDKKLAKIIKKRKTGTRLFDTSETQVRDYFNDKTKGKYQVKDLRTLKAAQIAKATKGTKKEVAIKVSEELGNTPAVALTSYIPPETLVGRKDK